MIIISNKSFKDGKKSVSFLGKFFVKETFKGRTKIKIFGHKIFSRTNRNLRLLNDLKERVDFLTCEQKVRTNSLLRELSANYLSQTIANQHQKIFPKYKNKEKGGTAVVVATGPTLAAYTPIKNAVHIGVNSTAKTNIPLKYWFATDIIAIETFIDKLVKLKCNKFVGICANPFSWKESYKASALNDHPRIIPDSVIEKIHANKFYFKTNLREISRNIELEPFYNLCSCVFSAVTFAVYLGVKRIYLVGCDSANNGYFDDRKQTGDFKADNIVKDWHLFAESLKLFYPDIEIVSINPVGLRGLFKDVYTKEYLKANPELREELGKNIEILNEKPDKKKTKRK